MTSFQERLLEDLISDSEDELPVGWEMRVTDEGRVFYVDHAARSTQWCHPKTAREKKLGKDLPFGWEKGEGDDGKAIFIDKINNRTTCIDPRIAYARTSKKKARMKFDGSSTAMAVLRGKDMCGKTALITGANTGIGFETARSLSLHGCHVILACRDVIKAKKAADKIRNEQSISIDIEVIRCDLTSMSSVQRCAEEIIRRNLRIHILVCNAGVFGLPHSLTEDGIETVFSTNHLAHFYLVDLLKDVLIESQPSRVIVVAGESHRYPTLYDDEEFSINSLSPKDASNYWPCVAYNRSKLCNLLFTFELNRRLSPYGVTCNAVHPGNFIPTNLSRNSYLYKFFFKFLQPFSKSKEQGAATTIYCATSEELEGVGGYYFNNCCGCHPSNLALNEDLQKKLWARSEWYIKNRENLGKNMIHYI